MNSLPKLKTSRLLLRPFRLDDAAAVQRLAGDRAIADTTLAIPHPYEDGMAEEWIGGHEAAWEKRESATWAITTGADGIVGAITLRLESSHRRAELGYWIGVPFWNRGYATEAARAVLGFAFHALELTRVHAHYLTRNPASGRVMQKVGMQLEGTLRQHTVKWDRAEDVAVYGILRGEFGR